MDNIVYTGEAHGRMDVMGGIADYSGSLVLEKGILEKTTVHFKLRNDNMIFAKTTAPEETEPSFQIEFETLLNNGYVDYEYAKKVLKAAKGGSWAAYAVGCILVLQKTKGINFCGGELEVNSTIPEGKGVSSSAALEIATFKALTKAFKVSFVGTEMPKLAQIVENQIVGAPCGLMDQIACTFGKTNELLPIVCQPDHLLDPVILPNDIHFVGIDSGVRHHVEGASYSDVRVAAYMGYSIIAKENNINKDQLFDTRNTNNRELLPYKGYLANISSDNWYKKYISKVPDQLSGEFFLNTFGNIIDATTNVNPDKTYYLKNCTEHPILEFERISLFLKLIKQLPEALNKISVYKKLGNLMYQSHQSYSNVLLGNKQTNRLVEMVKANEQNGVYGAKITGGGSGGTVCILAVGDQGRETATKIHQDYQNEVEKQVKIFL